MAATLYRTDGSSMPIVPDNGTAFSLNELYSHLQCEYIQVLNVGDILGVESLLIIDEEGKFSESPVMNNIATVIAHAHHSIARHDYIAGDAILCDSDMLD